MGTVNWWATGIAAILATALRIGWRRRLGAGEAGEWPATACVMLAAAVMLGHAYARIGAEKLAAKPWLYWMQSGGLVLAFVGPALWLALRQAGVPQRRALAEAGFWMVAYLVAGTVFFLMR